MSGEGSGESGAPNLNLSPEEKRQYGQLFRQADSDNVGVVTGEVAVKFFDKTRLDSRVLGEIWQIADKENRGFLTPAGFGIVLRLIGHAQAGREPNAEIALQQGPLPRFEGMQPPAPMGSPPPAAPIQAQGTGGAMRIPPLTPDKVSQYASLFERQNLQGGNTLPGDQTKQIFEKSGLPNEILGRIWQLADTEQRGSLVLTEFVIAMHLLTSIKSGALRAPPTVLPAALYEAATRRGSISSPHRQSPMNTGMSAIPRQLSGQAQMRAGSPLGRPPIGPQTTGSGSDWAVSQADKVKFDQIFTDLDKAGKGYITGEEAVPFFGQSNLPEDSLAQIWDLSDINSRGQLGRDEFAVAMYLIRQQRSGRGATLPSTLPPNLVPPSLRTQARPPTATSAFDPPPMTKPPPPQPKSAIEDLFGLDTSSPSPAPAAPAQTTMSTGGSNADPFAGGTSNLPPSSPARQATGNSTFKPFVPSSTFGRGLTGQQTGDSTPKQGAPPSAADDLLGDNDPEASKQITGESTELANLSNQVSSLSKQMQDVQSKRTATQNDLNQSNSQKQNFEQRLSQLRTLYEKEAKDTQALEEQLRNARNETKKLQGECMTLEGTYRDIQTQHQQVSTQLQSDQQENTKLRERIRVVNAEIAQLKPQIEKMKSEARQQKGLVAINKKQLSTTEGERDKLKSEADELTKSSEDVSRQMNSSSPASASAQVASPATSTASGNNPFFRRTASTDIMGAFASPPARSMTDKSFDDVFGPAAGGSAASAGPAPPVVAMHTGASSTSMGSTSTPPATSPNLSRQATMTADPPAPPESRQISSSLLPLGQQPDSLTSSRQVSPPASRAEGTGNDASNPFPGPAAPAEATSETPAGQNDDVTGGSTQETVDTAVEEAPTGPKTTKTGKDSTDPFANADQDKAKADFDNAFAAFTSAKSQNKPGVDASKPLSAFNAQFPPISDVEHDSESDSDSEGGFEDDFTTASPANKAKEQQKSALETEPQPTEATPTVPPKEPLDKSAEQPSSPATITGANSGAVANSTVDDIFGSAASGADPSSQQPAPSNPPGKEAFDDLDDEFEGLEDAKEGSADDDFANISRSGLDDFNPVFDSSPPASQTKSESTAFGNESSFDFVSSNSASGAPALTSENQQKGGESHDWDAIFASLDDPSTNAANAEPASTDANNASSNGNSLAPPGKPAVTRPTAGRALTETGEHDDPILKNLTGMGYSRADAVAALEKYDYNLERAANFLASQS